MDIRIGTSGWTYPHWRGPFYPSTLRTADWFRFYAERFDACEINGSFYRLPSEAAVASWAAKAPAGFVFAWKVSRYLTHAKRLKDPADSLALIFGRMRALGVHRGPALFQLHPLMRRDDARLEGLLELLPPDFRHAIEFRHPSWYADGVYTLLHAYGVGFCISDHHDAPSPWVETGRLVYLRAHGPGGHYHGAYDDGTLEDWARRIAAANAIGREVHAYFDNDVGAEAPRDAERLRSMVAMV
ncbi:MAG: DUF72 domain-containing protein [Acetobacteraceae bacterium]|nr:DUF72 domain-containing protein [Acetobacteraceae bacterium]